MLNLLKKGRIGGVTLIYTPLAALIILAALTTNSTGELNSSGWISGTVGLIISFPWVFVGMGIVYNSPLDFDTYMPMVIVISCCINVVMCYFLDGEHQNGNGREKSDVRKH